ncbi:hypothetical protein [Hydrogenophaga sp.]|uniref:hypothetical protein n=1 Tax=Hydrogenophaga sp. TaxID=1904254 RepID=UPI00271CABAC|nr:hypothetical protein [Hydrogenophaga sp.]MDO9504251.1 hypothetical protein [Hydrogenophaga sp.]
MTSFFSERTAEYSILPVVVSYLQRRFGAAVPMYYWASREGNSVAREVHDGRHVRMLALFARRPKSVTKRTMSGKLNAELFEFADRAERHGVPTVAGFPVVRDLFELGEDFQTFWFPLTRSPAQEVFFQVDLTRPNPTPMSQNGRPIRTVELCDLGDTVSSAAVLSWKAAMAAISDARTSPRMGGAAFWGGSPYNPVYVLVPA